MKKLVVVKTIQVNFQIHLAYKIACHFVIESIVLNFIESVEDLNDDDQQLQMALQMSLDEISIAKSKDTSKCDDDSDTVLPVNSFLENTNKKANIPVILPK